MTEYPADKDPLRPASGQAPADLLAAWTNDDLLLTEAAQQVVQKAYPRALPVMLWETLNAEFAVHDRLANTYKKKLNRSGLAGAMLSAWGASLLALEPLVRHVPWMPADAAKKAVVLTGCLAVLAGALVGCWHLLGHGGRAKWLLHRLWTERLRQFRFQHLINNLDPAVAVMADPGALDSYRSQRDGALGAFIAETKRNLAARSFATSILWLANDHDDAHAWGQVSWHANQVQPDAAMTPHHESLFQCLSMGRIGVQEYYALINLKRSGRTQGNMARSMRLRGNVATLVFVVALTLVGFVALSGNEGIKDALKDALIAVSGIAAAWGLYFRLADQGMGYSFDTERYELYREQTDLVRRRFDAAENSVRDKVSALRQLELYSYRELRQFLRTHLQSRFLG